jgi:hypothetical protein
MLGWLGFALEGLSVGTATALGLAGAAALTALYLLNPRRRRVVVAFAPLWQPSAGERRAVRWARRLRRWLSLALQLVVFGLLLFAAADPRPAGTDAAGRSVVVLVDRSASMAAGDEPDTRLGAARARARHWLTGLGGADRALVASFASDVAAETGFEPAVDGAARLSRALDRVVPSDEPADLARALSFAAALLRGRPHPTVILVSDGAFPEQARQLDPATTAGLDVRWLAVGRRARNVALLGFSARRLPSDPTTVEAALTLRNFGDAPATVTLEIAAARAVVDRARLTLAPGETRRYALPDATTPDGLLEARLIHDGAPDDLAIDDRAFAVVPTPERRRVLRVGAPDLYLDGALLSLGATVTVDRARPENVEETRARWATYDAVIFDGVAPTPAPTSGHFLYLAPRGPGSPFAVRGTLAAPVISDVRRGHPLVRQLDLADVNIAEAARLSLEAGDVAVASSLGAPLIAARERPGLRVAALAFDLRRSDLPMRAAFPLLLANAIEWLAGSAGREVMPALTGTTARVPVPAGTKEIEIADPTGARAKWPTDGEVAAVPIRHPGFYRVDRVTLAANLGDAVESDTRPPRALALGGATLKAPDAPKGRARRPLAVWALLLASALLLIEWATTHRRWTV